MEKHFDIMIVGAGPAGLTAALYAARSGHSVAVIEKLSAGGQLAITPKIENYPGEGSISGFELSQKMAQQAEAAGAKIIYDTVLKLLVLGAEKKAELSYSGTITAKAVILAMGAATKKLGVLGEENLVGSGVSYCATCDGAFFKGKDVVVVGSGGHAKTDVKYLSALANKIYVVSSGDIADDFKHSNTVLMPQSTVVELSGFPLSGVSVSSGGKVTDIAVSGLFVAVGYEPNTALVASQVGLSSRGYILTNEYMQTNIEGVFAAGDVTEKQLRQVVTACADGATAAHFAGRFTKKNK